MYAIPYQLTVFFNLSSHLYHPYSTYIGPFLKFGLKSYQNTHLCSVIYLRVDLCGKVRILKTCSRDHILCWDSFLLLLSGLFFEGFLHFVLGKVAWTFLTLLRVVILHLFFVFCLIFVWFLFVKFKVWRGFVCIW